MQAQTGFCSWRDGALAAPNKLPLAGKRVVVTRAPEQAGALVRELERRGAEVLLLPAVRFAELEAPGPLDDAIRSLGSFDWVVFTSQNAVRFFCERCRALGCDWSSVPLPRPRVAAVGPATAAAARQQGLPVDRMASRFRGEALAEELVSEVAGKSVLLPRSDRARGELPAALRAAGAKVVDVVAYRTLALEPDANGVFDRISQGGVDVISFASPSAFHYFAEAMGPEGLQKMAGRVVVAAIGPTTACAIREGGVCVEIRAAESTSESLAAAIAQYFARRASSGVESP